MSLMTDEDGEFWMVWIEFETRERVIGTMEVI